MIVRPEPTFRITTNNIHTEAWLWAKSETLRFWQTITGC